MKKFRDLVAETPSRPDTVSDPQYTITLTRPGGTGGTVEAPTLREAVDAAAPMLGIIDDQLELANLTNAVTLLLRKRGVR